MTYIVSGGALNSTNSPNWSSMYDLGKHQGYHFFGISGNLEKDPKSGKGLGICVVAEIW